MADEIRPRNVWDIETEHWNPILGTLTDLERRTLWGLRNWLYIGGEWERREGHPRRWHAMSQAHLVHEGTAAEETLKRWREQDGGLEAREIARWVGGIKAHWTRYTAKAVRDAEAILAEVRTT